MQGKTFIIAVFCVVRCILYPGTSICVASFNREQANQILIKIRDILVPRSANLDAEIDTITIAAQRGEIKFHNDSKIFIVTANEGSRSNRSNIIIVDEFRMVKKDIIDTVIRRFNVVSRQPNFINLPEYKNNSKYQERNKEFYMSSAWFKSHWSYDKMVTYCENMLVDSKNYYCVGFPYQLSIKEGLLMREALEDEMSESDFNEMGHDMEMGCLWFADDDGTFFKYEDISKTRQIPHAFFPPETAALLNDKKLAIPELKAGERRILSIDIAVMRSKRGENDASSIFLNQLLPSGKKYFSNIVYGENLEGMHTEDQALRIRKLFDYFKCTDLVIDRGGYGFGVADALLRSMIDPRTGETFDALSCCNDEEFAQRCNEPDARKVIWSIQANQKMNSDCANMLQQGFKQGRVKLLIPDLECVDELIKYTGYHKLDSADKIKFQLPYINTTLLVNELVNLDYEHNSTSNTIKIVEKAGHRKDRYSSLSYNYYIADQLAQKLLRPKKSFDIKGYLSLSRAPKI